MPEKKMKPWAIVLMLLLFLLLIGGLAVMMLSMLDPDFMLGGPLPTTTPTTVATKAPTTLLTSVPTTLPTTAPTTALTSASTSEPTTAPTTAPTTVKTTASTIKATLKPTTQATHKHSYTNHKIAATCSTDGYTLRFCACGVSYKSNTVPALGHTWSEWEVLVEPTVSSVGKRQRTCSHCKEVATEVIPALDPDTGKTYEHYIDPRIETDRSGTGVRYIYKDIRVIDRRTWGDPPSIWANEDGSVTVVYFDANGAKVEATVEPPPNDYVRRLIIRTDGTYTFGLVGDPS